MSNSIERTINFFLLSTVPDPLVMAPFVPGDFIEYSGYSSGGEISCFEITATNIQIITGSTAANGRPTYIRMEDAIIGVFSANPNAEAGQSRVSSVVQCSANVVLTFDDSSSATPPTQLVLLSLFLPLTLTYALARRPCELSPAPSLIPLVAKHVTSLRYA